MAEQAAVNRWVVGSNPTGGATETIKRCQMETIELKAEIRKELRKNKVKKLRKENKVPATIYGDKKENIYVKIAENELIKIYKKGNKKNNILKLIIQSEDKEFNETVISYQVDTHVLSNQITHIDFLRVSEKKPVTVTVPIKLVGNAPGLRKGGILIQRSRSLKIACDAEKIPNSIEINIGNLELDEYIKVQNIRENFDFKILNTDHDNIVRIASSRLSQQANSEEDSSAAKS